MPSHSKLEPLQAQAVSAAEGLWQTWGREALLSVVESMGGDLGGVSTEVKGWTSALVVTQFGCKLLCP